jgi:hypothetical protein
LIVAADDAVGRRLGTVFDEGTVKVDCLVEPGAMMCRIYASAFKVTAAAVEGDDGVGYLDSPLCFDFNCNQIKARATSISTATKHQNEKITRNLIFPVFRNLLPVHPT